MWYKFAREISELPIKLPDYVGSILSDISGVGGRALVVGGAVRDALLGKSPKDIDFEVYNISYDSLNDILRRYGSADLVGKSFGVIKFVGPDGTDFDFSLPRLDSKAGVGHKDFEVQVSSDLTPEQAAARRDFTINAISYDPITKEIIDPYNGRSDLKNKILRHTSTAFSEDPLRVMRGMQFAARFGFDLAPETADLARSIMEEHKHLPKERIYEEFKKLTQKGVEPGRAIKYLQDTGWIENYPDIKALQGVEQEQEWHPEGDVSTHTSHVMNAAAEIADREKLSPEDREVLLYAALTHDFAKPKTTKIINKKGKDRITSHGHEQEGGPMAREFLKSIGAPQHIINKVVPLVELHLSHVHATASPNKDSFVKNLAEKLHPTNIKMLQYLIEADHSGRPPLPKELPEEARTLTELAKQHNVYHGRHPDLLTGKDIIQYTGGVGGTFVGDILKEHRKMILQHRPEMMDRESALNWLDKKMSQRARLLSGSDLTQRGITGPKIREILDQSWQAQQAGVFATREQALDWLDQKLKQGADEQPPESL